MNVGPLAPAFVFAMLTSCSPEVPDGALPCQSASQCPDTWVCEARGGDPRPRCFQHAASAPSFDASAMGMDASQIPFRSGGGQTHTPDAEGAYACGGWQPVHATDAPPANAEPYGLEHTEHGPRGEYVCRFETKLDDQSLIVQGRAVFGQSCLSTLPATDLVPEERPRAAADFDVLIDTKHCARMVTYYESTRLMPTGTDVHGNPTYSCIGITKSPGAVPGLSKYLGRFEPASKRCVFELNGHVRTAPSTTDPEESMEVLAIP